jgi:hypothetical protein
VASRLVLQEDIDRAADTREGEAHLGLGEQRMQPTQSLGGTNGVQRTERAVTYFRMCIITGV